MKVFVPFEPRNPKTRLSPVLSKQERIELAERMLRDVVSTVHEADQEPVVLSTRKPGFSVDADLRIDDASLDDAVNRALDDLQPPIGVVMSDLAVMDAEAFEKLTDSDSDSDCDLAVAPGLRGGTNAFVTRTEKFRVDYHGVSYLDHRKKAVDMELDFEAVDSFKLSLDIDEPRDLPELLIHGDGEAHDFLDNKFEIQPPNPSPSETDEDRDTGFYADHELGLKRS